MPASASNGLAASQNASIGTSAGVVVSSRGDRKRLTVIQMGTTPVYLGSSAAVTTSNGALLAGVVGQTLVFETTAALYGIVSSGTGSVSVVEEFS